MNFQNTGANWYSFSHHFNAINNQQLKAFNDNNETTLFSLDLYEIDFLKQRK